MRRLPKDKFALVTGGGTGMGRSTALETSRCGARIALFGRRLEVVEKRAGEIRELCGEALTLQGDIREAEQIDAAMTRK